MRAADELEPLQWAQWPTPFVFFTGKGGVGKTTVAAASALALAAAGRKTLIVSTDPASNLADVFELRAGSEPIEVPGTPGLWVMDLDPEAAAAAHRERVVGPYRGVLPEDALRSIEEQLSGACTVEIAAFDEFTAVLADPAILERFDHVLFDTAPTGHTLRLLTLPSAWTGFMEANTTGTSCLGPLAGLEGQRAQYGATVDALANPESTTIVLVSRPEHSALAEAARAGSELVTLGIANQRLVLNGVLADHPDGDRVAAALRERQQDALATAPAFLDTLPTAAVALTAGDLVGVAALRSLTRGEAADHAVSTDPASVQLAGLDALVDELTAPGRGVVMTLGKGGVGKTTLAAAIAVAIAHQGHRVVLSTTDPAAHLNGALGGETPEGIKVERIDPAVETARYSAEVLAGTPGLDDDGRALLEEHMRSPCTEEIAVFRAFARAVDAARDAIVVLDTAPTGHTLLLLDATQSYQREVERSAGNVPEAVRTLLGRLRDPDYARVLVVTLAESTPLAEAARLQDDLRRAGIQPFGWVINATLSESGTAHPLLSRRARLEERHIQRATDHLAARAWQVPWHEQAPTGQAALLALTR